MRCEEPSRFTILKSYRRYKSGIKENFKELSQKNDANIRYTQNNYLGRPIEHRYKKRRNVSFHGKYGKSEYIKTKSHSLNAILEELYSLGPEDGNERGKINYETGRPLIPRIKLKRSTSSLKEDRSYKTLYKMSSESEIFITGNSNNSSLNITVRNENNDINSMSDSNISILLNDHNCNEISRKSDENYFAKNFDDCMKRLQLIEKEHELIEKEDGDSQFCILQKDKEHIQINAPEINEISSTEAICNYEEIDYDNKDSGNGSNEANLMQNETKPANPCTDDTENTKSLLNLKSTPIESIKTTTTEDNGTCVNENEEPLPATWYSNLKQQFEKKEQDEQKTKEMSCRITGATLKSQNEKTKPDEDKEKDTRHYFSRLVKTNKSLIDEELPDPDKVKHIRAMFQENLNSTLKRRLDKKLGGSLQNISVRPTTEQHMSRPLSAQCYRNDLFCDPGSNQKSTEEKEKTTAREALKSPRGGNGEFQIENTKKKLFEKYEKDLKPGRDYKNKRMLQPKWTDTGSVSSGIGSDLSSYDTDLECYSREGTEQDEMTMSDDDVLEEVKDKHYVQNEVLEKIRSFGTSVTYYGGEMITCSVGPLLSPTTQAIIEEITEKYGHETSPSRSFDEFYRKYVETNEPNRKKKLGRTRSFGQNDVFQKPNVLSNTEIDMYKNDLEIEIGIKKPAGIQQNSLKRSVTKSASLGCNNAEVANKINEVCSPISTTMLPTIHNLNAEVSQTGFCCMENGGTESGECRAVDDNTSNKNSGEMPNSKASSGHTETEYQCEMETEYKPKEKEEEASKTSSEKEHSFFRSKSVPEDSRNKKCEIILNDIDHPAKEIFFSYEKSLFNIKRDSDMEFEEFEVCESLSEKLEKLEKLNPHEKSIDNEEDLPSSSIEGKLKKPFENDGEDAGEEVKEKVEGVGLTTLAAENQGKESEFEEKHIMETVMERENENVHREKKDSRLNHSRWPIETTVVVDIQKNNEQTPKIITSGKTVAKTKIRLF